MIAAMTIVVSAICCKEGAMALDDTVLAIDYSCLPHQNLEKFTKAWLQAAEHVGGCVKSWGSVRPQTQNLWFLTAW